MSIISGLCSVIAVMLIAIVMLIIVIVIRRILRRLCTCQRLCCVVVQRERELWSHCQRGASNNKRFLKLYIFNVCCRHSPYTYSVTKQ